MVVKNKKPFNVGVFFAITFLGVLLMIFSPLFGGKNGLQFADDSFNKLAKGSSYFIPKVSESVDKFAGKPMTVNVKLEKADQAENTATLFRKAGATVEVNGSELKVQGDMGAVLKAAVGDADLMYNNDGQAISAKYGYDEKQAMKNWWFALDRIEKGMKRDKLIAEAKIVGDVNKKAVEPGYNFYKIDAQKVSKHAGMMSGLLIFYVLYTMWWGYAIFYMFEGIGLTMKKAKKKIEA